MSTMRSAASRSAVKTVKGPVPMERCTVQLPLPREQLKQEDKTESGAALEKCQVGTSRSSLCLGDMVTFLPNVFYFLVVSVSTVYSNHWSFVQDYAG